MTNDQFHNLVNYIMPLYGYKAMFLDTADGFFTDNSDRLFLHIYSNNGTIWAETSFSFNRYLDYTLDNRRQSLLSINCSSPLTTSIEDYVQQNFIPQSLIYLD